MNKFGQLIDASFSDFFIFHFFNNFFIFSLSSSFLPPRPTFLLVPPSPSFLLPPHSSFLLVQHSLNHLESVKVHLLLILTKALPTDQPMDGQGLFQRWKKNGLHRDGPIIQPTDRRTDTTSNRDARTHLKNKKKATQNGKLLSNQNKPATLVEFRDFDWV